MLSVQAEAHLHGHSTLDGALKYTSSATEIHPGTLHLQHENDKEDLSSGRLLLDPVT